MKKPSINLFYSNPSVGGTGTIIRLLQSYFLCSSNTINIKVLLDKKSFEMADCNIFIQPKAIIFGLFSLLMHKNGDKNLFIIDMHPLGFKYLYKTIAYIFLSIVIFIFVNKSSLIVPNGNLASFFPYSRFTICSWDNFVMCIFNSSFKNILQYNKFIYYGNMSRKKYFQNFIKFANFYKSSGYKFSALGYLSNVAIGFDSVKFINSLAEVDPCSDILVWTSKFESYGLAYREYIKSNGFLIFLRKKLINDGVNNAVYMHSYDHITPLILFKIKENFKQSLVISNYTPLFDYISKYNHAK